MKKVVLVGVVALALGLSFSGGAWSQSKPPQQTTSPPYQQILLRIEHHAAWKFSFTANACLVKGDPTTLRVLLCGRYSSNYPGAPGAMIDQIKFAKAVARQYAALHGFRVKFDEDIKLWASKK